MDFAFEAEHELIRESTRDFVAKELMPGLRERDREARAEPAVLSKMAGAGLLGVAIPAKYSGSDTDYISLGIVCEELERGDSTFRVVMSVHLGLHSLTLLQWGTPEQKQKWLPDLATGRKIGAFALTEPNAGSDAINLSCRAKEDGDDFVLSGEKTWISLANQADQFLVTAITDPEASPSRRLSSFIVSRETEGFSSRAIHGKLGVRAGDTGSIFLDGVRVPKSAMLGGRGEGFKVAMSALDHGRYTVASGACGLIQACLDACVPYCHERVVGGEEIGRKQLVQQMIAKMSANLEIGRLLYSKVGWLANKGLRHTREVSLAKWTNCNAAFEAASDAVEVLGAYGYTDEFPVERYLRNARGAVIYEGTREVHTLMQAEYALGYRKDKPGVPMAPPYPFGPDV